jgi:hypothetical protein
MKIEIRQILDDLKRENAEELKKRIIQRIEHNLSCSETSLERIRSEIEILLPETKK